MCCTAEFRLICSLEHVANDGRSISHTSNRTTKTKAALEELSREVAVAAQTRYNMKYLEILADNLSQAGWSCGCVSAMIPTGKRSGLLTRIAATEGVSVVLGLQRDVKRPEKLLAARLRVS
jgi:hypothetical protein